jgi:putative thioredoxin
MTSSDFSLHGAVDLGARQAAAKRAQQRPAAASGTTSVVDVTDATFNAEVIDRSRDVPVLVDFWADWCQPCKQLGPILEKLAVEAAGRWVLAKVDIDANPALAQQLSRMGVQGIPFVAAVVAGQMLPVLNGAAPEPQVRQVLDQLFDALREQGLMPEGAPGDADAAAEQAPAADPVQAEAEAALQRGDLDAAASAFGKILESAPNDPYAISGLALVELQRRVQEYDLRQARDDAADRPGDAAAQARVADLDLVEGRVEEAFDRLIGTVRRTSGDERETARKHLLSLFEVLPPDDPRVAKARRRLASALF